jgi:hypothetical protein
MRGPKKKIEREKNGMDNGKKDRKKGNLSYLMLVRQLVTMLFEQVEGRIRRRCKELDARLA